MAESNISQMLECPVCMDYYEKPIRQCVQGHSFCFKCIRSLHRCPICRQKISEARNFALEELLEGALLPCENHEAGCKIKLSKHSVAAHKTECLYREVTCEGKLFCNWACNWHGHNIEEHFKGKHKEHISLQFNSSVTTEYNVTSNFSDIQLIAAHYQIFWYKHRIDINKQKAFWVFQYSGHKDLSGKFYYEFEFYTPPPSIRKFKVTEYCESNKQNIEEIFNEEKCVVISLKTLKQFLNEKNEYCFRFRIMKIKSEEQDKKKPVKHWINKK